MILMLMRKLGLPVPVPQGYELLIQAIAAPGQGSEHQQPAQIERNSGKGVIELEPSEMTENEFPVMVVSNVAAGDAAQQYQISGSGVIDVGRDVHEILSKPPQGNRSTKGVPGLCQKDNKTYERYH